MKTKKKSFLTAFGVRNIPVANTVALFLFLIKQQAMKHKGVYV